MFMDRRLNVVKMSVLQIELYIQCKPNKNFSSLLIWGKIYKLILKFMNNLEQSKQFCKRKTTWGNLHYLFSRLI